MDSVLIHGDVHDNGDRGDDLDFPSLLAGHNFVAHGGVHDNGDEGCPHLAKNGECENGEEGGKNLSIRVMEEKDSALGDPAFPKVHLCVLNKNDGDGAGDSVDGAVVMTNAKDVVSAPRVSFSQSMSSYAPSGIYGNNASVKSAGASPTSCSLMAGDGKGSLKEKQEIRAVEVAGNVKNADLAPSLNFSNDMRPNAKLGIIGDKICAQNSGQSPSSCSLMVGDGKVSLKEKQEIRAVEVAGNVKEQGDFREPFSNKEMHSFDNSNIGNESQILPCAPPPSLTSSAAAVSNGKYNNNKSGEHMHALIDQNLNGKNIFGFGKTSPDVALHVGCKDDVACILDADVAHLQGADVANPKISQIHMASPSSFKDVRGSPSYANVLNGTRRDETIGQNLSQQALHFIPPNIIDGRVKVSPPLKVAEEGSAIWRNTLVGYFIGKKLPFQVVNSIAHKIWGKFGLCEVLTSDNGFFLFKFANFQGACAVLDKAPWHMANRPLVIRHWQPSLTLNKEDVYKVPVWIRLYHVPIEYWTAKGLSFVASAVGCPLHADYITLSRKRLSYARVCVEIDAKEALIEEFDFQCSNGRWIPVKVDYEWVPQKCVTCGVFGHTLHSCPRNDLVKEEGKKWIPKSTIPSTIEAESTKDGGVKQDEWVTVSRRKNGKAAVVPFTCIPMDVVPINGVARTVEQGECSSKGMILATNLDDQEVETPMVLDVVPLAIREEGECTPIITLSHSSTKEDEIDTATVDSDSSLSNANQLAMRAKDSLEKKVKGRSGKHKKGSAKKGRKRQSPQGGSWR